MSEYRVEQGGGEWNVLTVDRPILLQAKCPSPASASRVARALAVLDAQEVQQAPSTRLLERQKAWLKYQCECEDLADRWEIGLCAACGILALLDAQEALNACTCEADNSGLGPCPVNEPFAAKRLETQP